MACLRCEGLGTLCPRCRRDHRHRRAFTQAIMPKQQNYAVLPEWAFDRVCQLKTAAAKNIALYFYKRTLKYYQYTAIITYHEFVYGRVFKNQALEQGSGCHSYREVAAGIRECLAAGIFTLERQVIQGRRCIVYRVCTPFDQAIREQHAQEADAALVGAAAAVAEARQQITPAHQPRRTSRANGRVSVSAEEAEQPPATTSAAQEAAEAEPSWGEQLARISETWHDTNPQEMRAYVRQLQEQGTLEDEDVAHILALADADLAVATRRGRPENPFGLFRYRLAVHAKVAAKAVQERREQEELYEANRRYWEEQAALRAAEQESEPDAAPTSPEGVTSDSLAGEPAEEITAGAETPAPLDRRARQIWESTLESLQPKITPATFNTWFRGTSAVSLNGYLLTVRVQTTAHRAHLETRFHDLIWSMLSDLVGTGAEVYFVVEGSQEEAQGPIWKTSAPESLEAPQPDPSLLPGEPAPAWANGAPSDEEASSSLPDTSGVCSAPAPLPADLPPDAPRFMHEAQAQGWPHVVLVGRRRAEVLEGQTDWWEFWKTSTRDEQMKALVALDKRRRSAQRREQRHDT
jgi:hypothetical protein